MEIKISLSVRDVFDYLSDSKNSTRILKLAEDKFLKKYPMFKYISEACSIEKIEIKSEIDYLELINWDDLSLDNIIEFFEHDYEDGIMNQAFDFKILYIDSLQEDLDKYKNELNRKVRIS